MQRDYNNNSSSGRKRESDQSEDDDSILSLAQFRSLSFIWQTQEIWRPEACRDSVIGAMPEKFSCFPPFFLLQEGKWKATHSEYLRRRSSLNGWKLLLIHLRSVVLRRRFSAAKITRSIKKENFSVGESYERQFLRSSRKCNEMKNEKLFTIIFISSRLGGLFFILIRWNSSS